MRTTKGKDAEVASAVAILGPSSGFIEFQQSVGHYSHFRTADRRCCTRIQDRKRCCGGAQKHYIDSAINDCTLGFVVLALIASVKGGKSWRNLWFAICQKISLGL
jgi:hypothetical protein